MDLARLEKQQQLSEGKREETSEPDINDAEIGENGRVFWPYMSERKLMQRVDAYILSIPDSKNKTNSHTTCCAESSKPKRQHPSSAESMDMSLCGGDERTDSLSPLHRSNDHEAAPRRPAGVQDGDARVPQTPTRKRTGWFGVDGRAWVQGHTSPTRGKPWRLV